MLFALQAATADAPLLKSFRLIPPVTFPPTAQELSPSLLFHWIICLFKLSSSLVIDIHLHTLHRAVSMPRDGILLVHCGWRAIIRSSVGINDSGKERQRPSTGWLCLPSLRLVKLQLSEFFFF